MASKKTAKVDALRRNTRARFEQWVQNPDCGANVVSAVADVSMAEVALREGAQPTGGQSRFAFARGVTFESALLRDDATSLRRELERRGVLAEGSTGFADLRTRLNHGPVKDLDAAYTQTLDLLRLAGAATTRARRAKLPSIIAGATVRIPGQPVMLPEGIGVLDVLVLRADGDGPLQLVVGEVKTYADRGGYTDPSGLATARAQAGVYVHALRLVIDDLGLGGDLEVSPDGFLVLTLPGSNLPRVRAGESLELQAFRAERGFARLRDAAREMSEFEAGDLEEGIAAVQAAETNYDQSCLSFCDRAEACRRRAEEAGDPVILGEDVARFLGGVAVPRALELMNGAGPGGPEEIDFVRRCEELDAVANA